MNRRRWRVTVVCVAFALATLVPVARAAAAELEPVSLPAAPRAEVEPNDSLATATPIQSGERIRGTLPAGVDVDMYAFTAQPGERLFANTVTAGSSGEADTVLTLRDSEGFELAKDDDSGSQSAKASSIAGFELVTGGTYYLEVTNGGSTTISPYDLYLQLRSGPPGTDLANGEVTGAHTAPNQQDSFPIQLQAGDTVFLSLGLSGEASKARLGLAFAGDGNKQTLAVPAAGEPLDASAPSEALTMTVSESGTYYAMVGSSDAFSTEAWAYDLSATVISASQLSCRTYSSVGGPIADGTTTVFPIPVDDSVQIVRAAVGLDLKESVMTDLDISLRNPSGVNLSLLEDFGSNAPGGQELMDAVFDDDAAVPPLYKSLRPLDLQPQGGPRLALLNGQPTQGTWAVTIRDDTLNFSSGTLFGAKLIFCGPESLLPVADSGGGSSGHQQSSAQQGTSPPAAPALSGLAIAPGSFRAARTGPMVMVKRPRNGGAMVSYQDSQVAQTNFVLSEANPGRKVGRKCVAESKANETGKPCTRWVKVISFIRNDLAGRNQFGFTGRVGARKLPPGDFRLQAKAFAPSGLTSAPVSVNFTILAPVTSTK